ncbi:MAG: NusA-like transcription termination signal-binding factor [Nanoarchaeota archaeon]|nr:NusA-like transcription termination signal-binding factor [Nanoarchaeota archaeon]
MIIFSNEIIGYINLFEKITKTHVKSCFFDEDILVFIVGPSELGKALGKQGANIRKLGNLFNKKLKLLEYNPNPKRFIANLIYPIKAEEIRLEDDIIKIKAANNKEKGQIYGREKSNFKKIKNIFAKFFSFQIEIE